MFDPEPTAAATSSPSGSRKKSDEATTKNPVESRLSPTTPGPWRDAVVALVRSGRDRFHRLVGAQLGRRCSRPPIYLVDDWVVEVFGAFYHHGSEPEFPVSQPPHEGDSNRLAPWQQTVAAPTGRRADIEAPRRSPRDLSWLRLWNEHAAMVRASHA